MLQLRRYERISVQNRQFRSNWAGWPKISPTNHSSCQKTRLNDLSYGLKIWTDLSSVLSQSTRLTERQTDRQTDGRTDSFLIARPRLHSMQRGKNVRPKWWDSSWNHAIAPLLLFCTSSYQSLNRQSARWHFVWCILMWNWKRPDGHHFYCCCVFLRITL